jgi:hypothetical protein
VADEIDVFRRAQKTADINYVDLEIKIVELNTDCTGGRAPLGFSGSALRA